jgi:hypothetical protein
LRSAGPECPQEIKEKVALFGLSRSAMHLREQLSASVISIKRESPI